MATEEAEESSKSGFADVMCKILNKPVTSSVKSNNYILTKGKSDRQRLKLQSEDEPKTKKTKTETDLTSQQKKKLSEKMSRRIPESYDKEKEREFRRIVTKGVVQLFNAVKNQQRTVDKTVNDKSLKRTEREEVLQSLTKQRFLDGLQNKIKQPAENVALEPVKEEPSWKILRDDYMIGGKIKDWDQDDDESDDNEGD